MKIFIALFAVLMLVSGCNSTSIITEIDPVTGKVSKVTETSESVIKQITDSTKNKTVYVWSKGWATKISVSMATAENPTPTFRIYAGNIDHGILSLHKDQQNMDKLSEIIKACNSSALSITAEGVKSE